MFDLNRYRLPGSEKRFSRVPADKACLIVLETRRHSKDFLDESLEEMKQLADAAAIRIVGTHQSQLRDPSPSHFLRQGKLAQISDDAKKRGANVLVFNSDLTPTQAGNIENFAGIPVLDRTGLILDIFSRRARSREGKLQVELAQLNYALPRIRGLGGVMSRLGGGIGTRGPGEQELEHDRRKVRRRIQQVKEELGKVRKHREILRAHRKRQNFFSIAIVGYTNAGKSTLLNALTGSQARVENKLFATLDPMVRAAPPSAGEPRPLGRAATNGRRDLLFVDTVGFLRDLPHALIEAFQATLEEVREVDLLIHVLDVSSPHAVEFKQAVEKVLKEIKAAGKPALLALNKADLLTDEDRRRVEVEWPEGILISAREKLGLESLRARIDGAVKGKS